MEKRGTAGALCVHVGIGKSTQGFDEIAMGLGVGVTKYAKPLCCPFQAGPSLEPQRRKNAAAAKAVMDAWGAWFGSMGAAGCPLLKAGIYIA